MCNLELLRRLVSLADEEENAIGSVLVNLSEKHQHVSFTFWPARNSFFPSLLLSLSPSLLQSAALGLAQTPRRRAERWDLRRVLRHSLSSLYM